MRLPEASIARSSAATPSRIPQARYSPISHFSTKP